MALDHSCQVQRHPLAKRGHDLYETPDVAVEALLRVERLPHRIWEPAAGRGAIVRVLRRAGHAVIASDVVDYGFPLDFVRDFLTETRMPAGTECILTNPPYRIVEPFVERALNLCPHVVLLLRLAFMESERRRGILEGRGLARIHVFRKRLPMMHRDGWQGRKANSGMAFAWYIFARNHTGPTVIDRISWENDTPCLHRDGGRAMIETALQYAGRGWRVIPCRSDKVSRIRNWQVAASSDPETIIAWWTQWP